MLRVIQLNADSLLGPQWTERRHEIIVWLDELDPDVVCLQEVWEGHQQPNTGGWIAEHAKGDWHWAFGGFASPSSERTKADPSFRFGSAILSRWPIDRVEVMSLPVCADTPGPPHVTMWPPALPHDFPFELLHVRTAGIDVYSTHLQPMPAQAAHRVAQVLFIDEAIGRTCDPTSPLPPLLCGDFNAEPTSDEVRFLTSKAVINGRSTFFQDSWALLHDRGGITWDPANELAAGSNEPPARIDYVFVGESAYRPAGAGRVLTASLAFNESRTGILASDHYGLCVDVAWPLRPAART